MTTFISDTFEIQLRAARQALLERLYAQRGGVRSRAEVAADKRARAADDNDAVADPAFDLGSVLGEREAGELAAIDAALARIADGSYGLCLDCGVQIPAARLHAQPTADRCLDCQTRAER
ncbi:MAG: TraR/DksA family transcriptional regulator [Comamonadaceae bacterium]|jgi:DnaK suppressor protein|uniref:TraR/DksA family transcriptional regulator n=1 Tax=Hydrogenophaga borbori TaxID=2294117 RepID=A0A372EHB3_9BURK|nr:MULTISPECIES: TraR/DksA family transcriptional regulator [Hydrogenophaga]NCT97621.1 TraR/DksA family transcriptional regulator [Comamonadaceae bacterium]RFP77848.1 TraR/DksA family transcriptional regulator [Hydrogenophaga borbori]WQB83167.1 TraR/DksA family transcriptional regulator [Hydrogenophaga sp. SNF1]